MNDVENYLVWWRFLGDPRGEPIRIYPDDWKRLEDRIAECQKEIEKLQEAIDRIDRKRRKKK